MFREIATWWLATLVLQFLDHHHQGGRLAALFVPKLQASYRWLLLLWLLELPVDRLVPPEAAAPLRPKPEDGAEPKLSYAQVDVAGGANTWPVRVPAEPLSIARELWAKKLPPAAPEALCALAPTRPEWSVITPRKFGGMGPPGIYASILPTCPTITVGR